MREVFVGVAEGALAADHGLVIGAVLARRLGQLVERDLVFLEPHAGRDCGRRGARLISLSETMRPSDGIHQQHLAGLQAALAA